MMDEKEFNALHPEMKLDLLVQQGVLIGKLGSGNESILLYRMDNLIAEVYFHIYRSDISAIIGYQDLGPYTNYLEYIKVEHLLQ